MLSKNHNYEIAYCSYDQTHVFVFDHHLKNVDTSKYTIIVFGSMEIYIWGDPELFYRGSRGEPKILTKLRTLLKGARNR